MKEFEDVQRGVRSLQPPTRLAYTPFLLFSLAGYAVMAALAASRSGFSGGSVSDDYSGRGAGYAKTSGELLETAHFHLFSMPLLLFVQGHLFLMTRWPRRVKVAIVLAASAGAALEIACPWPVAFVSRDLAIAKLAARVLLYPSLLAFAIVPLVEMWRPAREDDPREEAACPPPSGPRGE